jgi:inner membrane protein
MSTVFTHPAVPLAIGLGLGRRVVSTRLMACSAVGSVLPDLDVLTFRFGIPYAAEFGHRGFSHSLLFAVAVALAGACFCRFLKTTPLRALVFLLVAVASHGLLDTLTNGGLGIALFWPWSEQRHFAPLRPIEVAPFGLARLLSPRGAAVMTSELLWVWLPAIPLGAFAGFVRFALPHRLPTLLNGPKLPWQRPLQ